MAWTKETSMRKLVVFLTRSGTLGVVPAAQAVAKPFSTKG